MATVPESARQILLLHEAFTKARVDQWLADSLGTWQWWVLIALIVLPLIVWWHLVDKRRLVEICLLGMFVLATATWMDELGSELILWYYPYRPLPWYPQMVPTNYSVLPVTYMLIYQYARKWPSYVAAITAMAAVYSWGAEPLLHYMGIYQPINWRFCYSFPLYLLIGVSHRWLLEKVMALAKKSQGL